ncbi:MAG: hypothetical protein AAF963_02185 [Bacteroidota bacterium]
MKEAIAFDKMLVFIEKKQVYISPAFGGVFAKKKAKKLLSLLT